MKKSVSPEVYNQVMEECKTIAEHMKYYIEKTDISYDMDIFRHLVLIGSLADSVYHKDF